jgi:hypothetical protein
MGNSLSAAHVASRSTMSRWVSRALSIGALRMGLPGVVFSLAQKIHAGTTSLSSRRKGPGSISAMDAGLRPWMDRFVSVQYASPRLLRMA